MAKIYLGGLIKMSFPEYFPESCPFDNSRNENLVAYRAVDNKIKITPEDFIPLILDSKKSLKLTSDSIKCRACGLSIYTDINELKENIEIVPSLSKKEIIGIQVTKESGKVLETPPIKSPNSSHLTWWIYSQTNPIDLVIRGI